MRILFTDFDFTLATNDKKISKEDYGALKRLEENGVKVVLLTGRMSSSSKKVLSLFPFKTAFSAFNGGEIFDCDGKLLERTPLSVEDGIKFSKYAEENGLLCHAYTEEVITERENEYTKWYCDLLQSDGRYLGEPLSEYIKKVKLETPKIQFCDLSGNIDKHFDKMKRLYGDRYEFLLVGGNCLDISPKGITKGYALKRFCSFYGIDEKDAVAIGDDDNDISMIEEAGIGVAVANANIKVKNSANFVTKSENGQAIAEITEKIFKNF